MTDRGAVDRLLAWPRAELASLPTPLLRATRLGRALDRPDVLIKHDAETGFALGGNKVRKLEYVLEPSRLEGITCLVTAGGPQSNHCRITAAFAARAGLRCILVVQQPLSDPPDGNALLHHLFGAEIHAVPSRADREQGLREAAERVTAEGGMPLVVPLGASTGLGGLGYARAALELVDQLDALGPPPERTLLFVPTSSCGTLAGLTLGLTLAGRPDMVPVAVSADVPADELRERTLRIAADGAELLGTRVRPEAGDLVAVDDQVGAGYGIPTAASRQALELFARYEGVVLDPTYTAKAAAGMIDWIGGGRASRDDRVVFLHTGGHPALFAGR